MQRAQEKQKIRFISFFFLNSATFTSFIQGYLTGRELSPFTKEKTHLFTGHPCEGKQVDEDDSQISWLSELLSQPIPLSVCKTPCRQQHSSVVRRRVHLNSVHAHLQLLDVNKSNVPGKALILSKYKIPYHH